jgi:hypothetical protein
MTAEAPDRRGARDGYQRKLILRQAQDDGLEKNHYCLPQELPIPRKSG